MNKQLDLEIITQEKRVLATTAKTITVMTSTGELTILPGHISIFTKLSPGVLRYTNEQGEHYLAIYGGFMDVSAAGRVSILADAADRAEDIDQKRVDEAQEQAKKTLESKNPTPEDYLLAETALRRTYLQQKIARLRRGQV